MNFLPQDGKGGLRYLLLIKRRRKIFSSYSSRRVTLKEKEEEEEEEERCERKVSTLLLIFRLFLPNKVFPPFLFFFILGNFSPTFLRKGKDKSVRVAFNARKDDNPAGDTKDKERTHPPASRTLINISGKPLARMCPPIIPLSVPPVFASTAFPTQIDLRSTM